MKLIPWNVNACVKNGPTKQVEALAQRESHLVALQDISVTQYDRLLLKLACAIRSIFYFPNFLRFRRRFNVYGGGPLVQNRQR